MSFRLSHLNQHGFGHFLILSGSCLEKLQGIVTAVISEYLQQPLNFQDVLKLDRASLGSLMKDKRLRTFNPQRVRQFIGLTAISEILKFNPEYQIAEGVDPIDGPTNGPEIYFRVVPPGSGGNEEAAHLDRWFDDAYHVPKSKRASLKMWVSLMTEPGKNGLLFLPNQEEYNLDYELISTPFGPRPALKKPIALSEYILPSVSPGYGFVFETQSVLHLGAPNRGTLNRLSLEVGFRRTVC